MTESHYEDILRDALRRFRDLYEKREQIDVELVKLRQFLYATLNMVPDKDKSELEKQINSAVQQATASAASLADSVRKIYRVHPNYGYTVGGIREMLLDAGFDFSSYKSNPLSSISTTLRRMVETGELDTRETAEGETLYIPHIPESDVHPVRRKRK